MCVCVRGGREIPHTPKCIHVHAHNIVLQVKQEGSTKNLQKAGAWRSMIYTFTMKINVGEIQLTPP